MHEVGGMEGRKDEETKLFVYNIMYYNILVQWQKVTTLLVVVSIVKKGGRKRRNGGKGYEWMDMERNRLIRCYIC